MLEEISFLPTTISTPAAIALIVIFLPILIYIVAQVVQAFRSPRSFFEAITEAGFDYDPSQDIFFSRHDAWQKKYGYCKLYDEALAPLGMVVDCEPIRFDHNGERWMIELWKGQYGICTGAEIGVYKAVGPDINIPGLFQGAFYKAVDNDDQLKMALVFNKANEIMFIRSAKHWWLTGFKLGEFSEPEELASAVRIDFKDKQMLEAFENALISLGYSEEQYRTADSSVELYFDKPFADQPNTRSSEICELAQIKNKALCKAFNHATAHAANSIDKMEYLRVENPHMYKEIKSILRNKQKFKGYRSLRRKARDF